MRYPFKLPDLAEGMMEVVVGWLVATGDEVKPEQPVAEVMTDKATVVIPAPHEGRILELCWSAGDIVPVGDVLWVMEVDDDVPAQILSSSVGAGAPASSQAEAQATPASSSGGEAASEAASASASTASAPPRVPRGAGKALATPATRRLARELGVDIGAVKGSGPHGRVSQEDVRAQHAAQTQPVAMAQPAAIAPSRVQAPTAGHTASQAAPVTPPSGPVYQYAPSPRRAGEEAEERVPLRGLRRAIYETMGRSTRTAAHFTYVDEVDCENLVLARKRLKAASEARGVRLTYLPFIAKATLLALRRFPKMNASMDDAASEMVLKRHYHLGVAAATPAGLVVPVVKHADQLSLLDLAGHVQDLGLRARDNKLRVDEVSGSTFTITSLGKLGGLMATPIINHPEVAILGVHQMNKRAVVRDDAIVARTMMNISLSFDHRVIDGHEGAAFAAAIKVYLEDPELMLLEMA